MNRAFLLGALGVGGYLAYRALTARDYRKTFGSKHVVITGGSRGLGLVLARQFARAGARLSICSRDPDELTRAVVDLSERGARVVAVECDITSRDRVREFIAVARRRNGPSMCSSTTPGSSASGRWRRCARRTSSRRSRRTSGGRCT